MGNNPVRTRLFISTLKGVDFEWFRKLPKGSVTCWDDLQVLFLSRFFEEEAHINMHTLLLTKQKEGELVKDFIERFQELVMRSRGGMTPETLVETCRHNFLTPILVQMGAVDNSLKYTIFDTYLGREINHLMAKLSINTLKI